MSDPLTAALPPATVRAHFELDPEIVFLNHGSFGACPRAVLERQTERRLRLEREPVRYFLREFEGELDATRTALATFLGADREGIVFVQNATTAVNVALATLADELSPGHEVLVTDHEYNACRNALDRVIEQTGASLIVISLPFPLQSADEIVMRIHSAVTDRTRALLLDHVTSPTGLVLPVRRIAAPLLARGIVVIVDGAHAPGMIPLALEELGVTAYAGNCHKWICAPKGSAFLYVPDPERRRRTLPRVTSHGANTPELRRPRFRSEFDWPGTFDPTPWLGVKDALEFVPTLHPLGWPGVMQANHRKVLAGRQILLDALGISDPAPATMLGALATVPLPDGERYAVTSPFSTDPLQDRLLFEHRIEVPIGAWPRQPRRVLRISAQLYNDLGEYRYLAECLGRLGVL